MRVNDVSVVENEHSNCSHTIKHQQLAPSPLDPTSPQKKIVFSTLGKSQREVAQRTRRQWEQSSLNNKERGRSAKHLILTFPLGNVTDSSSNCQKRKRSISPKDAEDDLSARFSDPAFMMSDNG